MTSPEFETPEAIAISRPPTSDLPGASTAVAKEPPTAANAEAEPNLPMFAQNDAQEFRSRWEKIQINFVDEPRKAVEQADTLVANTITKLAEVFATERHNLEAAWDRPDTVSTEDLRMALRRYRSFFNRLLAM